MVCTIYRTSGVVLTNLIIPTSSGWFKYMKNYMKLSACNAKKHICNPWISGVRFLRSLEVPGGCWCFFIHKNHEAQWCTFTYQKESKSLRNHILEEFHINIHSLRIYPNHHTGNKLSHCLKGKEKTHDIFLESPNSKIYGKFPGSLAPCVFFVVLRNTHSVFLRVAAKIQNLLVSCSEQFGVLKLRDLAQRYL